MNIALRLSLVFTMASSPLTLYAHGVERDCSKQVENHQLAEVEVVHRTSEVVFQDLKQKGVSVREARGYAILISAMVGSAAAATYLTSSLPQEFQFLSYFLAQVSTLGVYVFGAPIWEPLSSGFRKMAFGVRGSDSKVDSLADPKMEGIWRRTQEIYSLNEQMSRNVINQFVISVQQNFYEAYRASQSANPKYAADQIALAAYRLRTLFKDIPPEDTSVAIVVRSVFTDHIVVDEAFRTLVFERIRELDTSVSQPEVEKYYVQILRAWLDRQS